MYLNCRHTDTPRRLTNALKRDNPHDWSGFGLTHQDLAELVGAARPVINAELTRMRSEGLIEYTRCYFSVDDLAGLNQIAVR
jgi:CRP-like cAMP-binding protein